MKTRTKSGKSAVSASKDETVMRLQRFLAGAGLGGRRECEEIIASGRITVDGETVESIGLQVDLTKNKIAFDGETLKLQPKQYFMLNKPKGFICTNRDPGGRPKVVDIFPKNGPRLFTVGRLDEQSEGLIVVTNDGEFSNKLAHPRYRIYRTYHVQVAGLPSPDTLRQLREGHYFREGKFRAHNVKKVGRQGKSTFLEVVMTEGQNREVRRLLARVGHKVMSLKRIAFGPLKLGSLATGKYRPLTKNEHEQLADILTRNAKTPAKDLKRSATRKSVKKAPGKRVTPKRK